MKLISPKPSNNSQHLETMHRCCLLFGLMIITAAAHAVQPAEGNLQPRQAIAPVTLPSEAVSFLAALPAVEDHFELLAKFEDSVRARISQKGLFSEMRESRMTSVEAIASSYSAGFRQILNSTSCPNLDVLLNEAASRSGVAQPDLEGLYQVTFPPTLSGQELLNLRSDLLASADVEYVELRIAGPGAPPSVTPDYSTGPAPSQALYRGPDPGGNFDIAHGLGIIGSGIRLSEVSVAFNFRHEEFVTEVIGTNAPTEIEGYVSDGAGEWDAWVDHGTATMSQNLAPDNGFGVTGMSHGADGQFYRSYRRSGIALISELDEGYCNALADSVANGQGNVVYLEHQTASRFPDDPPDLGTLIPSGGPMEIQETAYLITQCGTDAGVVVLMPAGNAELNLDTNANSFVQAWRARSDSGAIIVGAGTADLQHNRALWSHPFWTGSSFGSRVNLQGWGESVVAAGYGLLDQVDGDIDRRYIDIFNGTSSATPMVAGAAVLTQEAALGQGIPALDSREMRAFLAATGVPQGTAVAGNVGPFVDVGRAVMEVTHADLAVEITNPLPMADLVTTTITNNGPREAALVEVQIDFQSAGYVPLSLPDSCTISLEPPQADCANGCSGQIQCNLIEVPHGSQTEIQFDGNGQVGFLQLTSAVSLIDILNDPDLTNNSRWYSIIAN